MWLAWLGLGRGWGGRYAPSEDHGVGDVGALEFVETEDAGLLGDVGCDVEDCV